MKNIKYTLFTIIMLFISIFHVNASCTNEEISALKELADDIKITYKHLGRVEDNEGTFHYNNFEINVKNISNDFYIMTLSNTIKLLPENEMIKTVMTSGTWNFDIYSNKCEEKISEIEVFIPKFNTYSLDPLCDGVDGKNFPLCGKYYEYDVSYNNFVERVKHYRTVHNIGSNVDIDDKEEKNFFQLIYDKVLNFLVNYKLYVIISISIVLISIIAIVLVKRRKKRGVLE